MKLIYSLAIFLVIGLFFQLNSTFAQEFEEPSYTIDGGKVLGFEVDTEVLSLIVELETWSDGEIKISLPRNLMDSKIDIDDDDFLVLIDGDEVLFEEQKSSIDRTLTIPFKQGDFNIEIIGTEIIPEFSSMAVLVLGSAIGISYFLKNSFKI